MQTFIELKKSQRPEGYFKFSISQKAFYALPGAREQLLKKLSSQQTIALTSSINKENGERGCKVYTPFGCFFGAFIFDKNEVLLTSFHNSELRDHNEVMKNGVNFFPKDGIIVAATVKDRDDPSLKVINDYFINGETYPASEQWMINYPIRDAFDAVQRIALSEEAEQKEKKEVITEGLRSLLETARNYSDLTFDFEREEINRKGDIPYFDFGTVNYFRKDRQAYSLTIDKTEDNEQLAEGMSIEISLKAAEGKNAKRENAEIIKVEQRDDKICLTVLFTRQININDVSGAGRFNIAISNVVHEVQQNTIKRIEDGTSPATSYLNLFFGEHKTADIENKDVKSIIDEWEEKGRTGGEVPNPSQREAIINGIRSKALYLVVGPPGTGKTTVIQEWVRYFVEHEHKRVLVSSQNNSAVDNVLERLPGDKINILRIGKENKIKDTVEPFLFEKKIESLRNGIVKSAVTSIQALDSLGRQWNRYYGRIREQTDYVSQMEGQRERFRQAAEKGGIGTYIQLRKLFEKSKTTIEKGLALRGEIGTLRGKIEGYKRKSLWRRAIGYLQFREYMKALKEKETVYAECREMERKISREYNNLAPDYFSLLETLKQDSFRKLYEKCSIVMDNIPELEQTVPKCPNIWNLFSRGVSAEDLSKGSRVRRLEEYILKELDKARALRSLIYEWGDQVENTQNYALNEVVLETVDLVGATCIGVSSQPRFQNLEFDVTIIDEAGQIQVQNALVPMSVSPKVIMLGDHQQIPPYSEEDVLKAAEDHGITTELLEKSLFEKMYKDMPDDPLSKTMLDTQYRMPAGIASVLSKWFYGGEYHSFDGKRNMPCLLPALADRPFILINTADYHGPEKREQRPSNGMGRYNEYEAMIVSELIRYILITLPGVTLDDMGVITAYSAQINCIREKLTNIIGEPERSRMVATVDSFQGQEKDVIIYSFVRTARDVGFLAELRRLNVAMSRCKKMLIMIGDYEALKKVGADEADPESRQRLEQFSGFIRFMLEKVHEGKGRELNSRKCMQIISGTI